MNIEKAKSILRDLIIKEGLIFTEVAMKSSALKLEYTYHPYKKYNQKMGLKEMFNPLDNLYVYHICILDRSGGLNLTAVLFCILENHIQNCFKK